MSDDYERNRITRIGSVVSGVMRFGTFIDGSTKMIRSIVLLLVAIACVGCRKQTDSTQQQPPASKIGVSCMMMRLEPQFIASFKWEADPPILNDIETFFLIDHPAGTKSNPIEFDAGETIRLADTFGSGNPNDYLYVSGELVGEATRLTISPAKESAIELDRNVVVELPKFGSAIIKTANPMLDNRCTYLWVMARQ